MSGSLYVLLHNAVLFRKNHFFSIKFCPDMLHPFSDCTMTWYAVRRPYDINYYHYATSTYVAAIMVEDFAPLINNVTRLSGVPLQMLIFVYTPVAGACSIVPNITGDRPNRACIGIIFCSRRFMYFRLCNCVLQELTLMCWSLSEL